MRRRTFLAALAATVAGAFLAPVGVDAKVVDQTYPVPASGIYKLQGHGWGHGHGMSQYGARGAARQGLSWKQILEFYYPGTALSTTAAEIRVLISGDTTDDVVVGQTAGLSVRDLTTGAVTPLSAPGATRWRLNPGGGGTNLAYYDGSWHQTATLAGAGEFFANGPVTLYLPSGSRAYRGALRATNNNTVNVLSIDDYVKGVVPDEMPSSWEPEAVRAQSVAARTYAAWSRATRESSYYQICDTTSCQVYGGASAEEPRSNEAVAATAGQILTYNGRPAFSQFSSSSGGWTSAGSVPYLVSKADPYEAASGNPYTNWTVDLPVKALQARYPGIGTLQRINVTRREGGGDWEGRVWSIVLDGSKADVTVSGDAFRSAFGLRSTYFTFGAGTTNPTKLDTPILKRWAAIGGDASPVGAITGKQRKVKGGLAQDFATGTIYWSAKYGAREVYGPVLAKYKARGEASSVLGLPKRGVRVRGDGLRGDFARGLITARPDLPTTILRGAIVRKYVAEGGLTGRLGWPTKGNFKAGGRTRANFERGYIVWNQRTGKLKVVIG